MRILIVGAIKGGTVPIGRAVYSAFKAIGVDADFLDYSEFEGEFSSIRSSQDDQKSYQFHLNLKITLLERVYAFRPDVILGISQSPMNDTAILAELKKAGIVLCYWFTEDYRCFDYWRETAFHFHHFFTIQETPFWKELEAVGCRSYHYLPAAFDVNLECSNGNPEDTIPVSFLGAPYPNRVHFFDDLPETGFQIYGEEWDRYPNASVIIGSRRIAECEARDIYARSTINLNLHSSTNPTGFGGDFVNPRTFELAGLGAFQLTDMRKLLTLHFDPATEIIALSNWEEMKWAIEYFLEHDREREEIAGRARERVLREHTYEHRAREILDVVGRG
ncbi:MAG: glycosyltransferase [Pseudomonadota bacterium]